jgi:enoyl-[acyl-carrier protein] reductase II
VIRTPVCDLLGITVPVVAAPFGPWEQVDLAAAVSRAGAPPTSCAASGGACGA